MRQFNQAEVTRQPGFAETPRPRSTIRRYFLGFQYCNTHLRTTIINHASEGNLLAKEAFSRQLDELEAELAGPAPSLMERLLAQRIALGWAMTHIAETDGFTKSTKGGNENACVQRRMDSANRRLMQSMKALATVRRLLPPTKKIAVFAGNDGSDE